MFYYFDFIKSISPITININPRYKLKPARKPGSEGTYSPIPIPINIPPTRLWLILSPI